MTAPVAASSAYIVDQQSQLVAALAVLEAEAEELSFAAVSGDDGAVARLADINAQIARGKDDAIVLDRAKAAADRREAEAGQAARIARQSEHRAEAARQAVDLIDLVEQADVAIDAFIGLTEQIGAAERRLRAEVRASGTPSDAWSVVGWISVVTMLHERLERAMDPRPYRSVPVVGPRVRSAWAFLVDDGERSDG